MGGKGSGRRNFKGQPNASPFRRIITARGVNLNEAAVYSGISLTTLRKLDRMDPKIMGSMSVGNLMRVAMYLEVAPVDLMPFLAATVKNPRKSSV